MGREACHTLPQILPCEAPSRREAPLPVPKARFTRKNELLSKRTKARFSCHVNPMDQFPSWWHKTVTQRSGHSFEARSSGASSHFVPLHHDPATRSRCRSEETPRPAKRPRRKAGARAKRGVSELCDRYTKDEPPTCRSGFNQLQKSETILQEFSSLYSPSNIGAFLMHYCKY